MKYYKKLIGERIYLSPMNAEDAEKYVEWFCDFKMTDGIGKSSSITTIQSEIEWIENNNKNGDLNFAIVDLENDELIGNCGIMNINYINRSVEVGIFIGDENKRSNGYGTESLRLLLDYGFNYLNLNNIHLGVKAFNERAIACYKKVGFKEYGRRHECYFLDGKWHDAIKMEVTEQDYRNTRLERA